MANASGRPEIAIGLIDGPVALDHPDLAAENIREVSGDLPAGVRRRRRCGMRSWHLRRRHSAGEARVAGSGDLSRLQSSRSTDLCRSTHQRRRDAERHCRRAFPGHL
jgi:hypothetical protein